MTAEAQSTREADNTDHDADVQPPIGSVQFPSVLESVAVVAAEEPSRLAVVAHAGRLTYGQLSGRAAALADRLRAAGVVPGARVVVVHSASPGMVVAVLAVLLTGAAYVPVDPGQPSSRVTAIVADCGATALVTDRPSGYGAAGVPVVDMGDERAVNASGSWTSPPDAPAYLIYTSGSTGEPKGVVVSHGQLAFSTSARRAVYPGASPFLLVSPLAFDSSVAGLWGTLTSGGTLVLADDDERRDPAALVGLVAEFGVQATLMIPSLYRLVLAADAGMLRVLQTVVVAGEALNEGLLREHFAALPGTELVNEYGPTEATVWATFRRYAEPGPVSIGVPVPGVEIRVLDAQQEQVDVGDEGELYVGGPGVVNGYYGRPAETAARFGPDPTGVSTGRWYRTGDLVRRTEHGELEFLGRTDRQVKVRGRRVQLEAVEAALLQVPFVAQAAVTTEDDDTMLVAHVSLNPPGHIEPVREAVALLPVELRPDRLHEHARLALSANGKVDLQALRRSEARTRSAAPPAGDRGEPGQADQLLTQVAAAWEEVLHSAQVPVDVNFFDLGGNSLLIVKLQTALERLTGKHASLVSLFRHTTIKAQAELLSSPAPSSRTDARSIRRTRADGGRRNLPGVERR